MIRILDLYIIRSIAAPTLLVAFALMVISSIMAFVGELESAESGGYGLGIALQFVLLTLPQGIYQLAPLTMLLGALLGLGALATGSELVVMRASGISLTRMAMAAALAGIGFGSLIYVLGDWLVPLSDRTSYNLRTEFRYGGQRSAQGGLWFREGDRYIHVENILALTRLGEVHEYAFDDKRRITTSMTAAGGLFRNGAWELSQVRESVMAGERIVPRNTETRRWDVRIDPELLGLSTVRPESLTLRGLWEYASYLESNGLAATDYRVALWRKLAMPVSIMVMSLLSVPFVVGSLRSTGNGQRLFMGILLGAGFYMINEIVSSSGQVYGLQPWMAVLMPTLLLAVVTLVWLRRVR